jgi:hypothetical protein
MRCQNERSACRIDLVVWTWTENGTVILCDMRSSSGRSASVAIFKAAFTASRSFKSASLGVFYALEHCIPWCVQRYGTCQPGNRCSVDRPFLRSRPYASSYAWLPSRFLRLVFTKSARHIAGLLEEFLQFVWYCLQYLCSQTHFLAEVNSCHP